MPSISIIIPTYNEEQYIEECLNSILNQTFTDYEIERRTLPFISVPE